MERNLIKRFYTVKELARYLSMSKDYIRACVKEGTMPYSNFGRSVRFDIYEIDKWVKQQQIVSAYQANVNNN